MLCWAMSFFMLSKSYQIITVWSVNGDFLPWLLFAGGLKDVGWEARGVLVPFLQVQPWTMVRKEQNIPQTSPSRAACELGRLLQSWDVVPGALEGCRATADGVALVQSMKRGFPPGQGTTRSPQPGITASAAVSPIPTVISCVNG